MQLARMADTGVVPFLLVLPSALMWQAHQAPVAVALRKDVAPGPQQPRPYRIHLRHASADF